MAAADRAAAVVAPTSYCWTCPGCEKRLVRDAGAVAPTCIDCQKVMELRDMPAAGPAGPAMERLVVKQRPPVAKPGRGRGFRLRPDPDDEAEIALARQAAEADAP